MSAAPDYWLLQGDSQQVLKRAPNDSIDAIVVDPPYGIRFMGKRWDYDVPSVGMFKEALRVLKDGGRMLCFAGARTSHRMAVNIEDAGFVIEDSVSFLLSADRIARELWDSLSDAQRRAFAHVLDAIAGPTHPLLWLYGSGFPKHRSKLKPAYEPVVVARKGGVSALNIDDARIPFATLDDESASKGKNQHAATGNGVRSNTVYGADHRDRTDYDAPGRWPANVALDDEAAAALDEQSGLLKAGMAVRHRSGGKTFGTDTLKPPLPDMGYGGSGGASRFFYCAKASRKEREAGLGDAEKRPGGSNAKGFTADVARGQDRNRPVGNPHPTVKPVALMRWLVRLVAKPGDLVLDFAMGSGTTGIAAVLEGVSFIGIDRDPAYVKIAAQRIAHWVTR